MGEKPCARERRDKAADAIKWRDEVGIGEEKKGEESKVYLERKRPLQERAEYARRLRTRNKVARGGGSPHKGRPR